MLPCLHHKTFCMRKILVLLSFAGIHACSSEVRTETARLSIGLSGGFIMMMSL